MDQTYWQMLEFPHINVTPGLVSLYKWENNQYTTHLYEDTENVHAFLAELVQPALTAHYTTPFTQAYVPTPGWEFIDWSIYYK